MMTKPDQAPQPPPLLKTKEENFAPSIMLEEVSRWYGEVLGISKVSVDIRPGMTGLVGPNGSGKSTMMNIICGLLQPGQGKVRVLGQPVWRQPELHRRLGYCTQVDHFYEEFTGRQFMEALLALQGGGKEWTVRIAQEALARVGLADDADRRIKAYSKGMRQRIKIALALAHQPEILVLDEPFNGLDPVGRREMMSLFADYARDGRTILLSSHILHEIEQMTDRILMMSNGFVLAEGEVHHVRDLLRRHPFRVFLRCAQPRKLASLMLDEDSVTRVELEDEQSLTLSTNNPDSFYERLHQLILKHEIELDLVTLSDENVQSIYHYLSGKEHH